MSTDDAAGGAFRGVLFDFDGTLADTIPLILESYRHTLAAVEGPVEEEVVRSWIGRTLIEVLEERHPCRARSWCSATGPTTWPSTTG